MHEQPKADPEMVKASLEAYERGDYLTTEELLMEIQDRRQRRQQWKSLYLLIAWLLVLSGAVLILMEVLP